MDPHYCLAMCRIRGHSAQAGTVARRSWGALPPGKRPFARWHAQAHPGTLGLMLGNAPGTLRATGVILHRAHKGLTRALRIHYIWSFIVTVTLVAPIIVHRVYHVRPPAPRPRGGSYCSRHSASLWGGARRVLNARVCGTMRGCTVRCRFNLKESDACEIKI